MNSDLPEEFQHIEPITTERLVLRQMTKDDTPDVFSFMSDFHTAYWAGMRPLKTLEEAWDAIYWGNIFGEEPQYGLTVKGSDKVIGTISVSKGRDSEGHLSVFLGYLILPEHTRKGYMSEAVKAVCDDIFRRNRAGKIICEIRKDNIPSRGLATKCGFVQNPDQMKWETNFYGKELDEFILENKFEISSRQ